MGKSNTEKSHSKKLAVIQKPLLATAVVLFLLPLWAALPTTVASSTVPAAGDWIGLIQGDIKDGGLVLGLAIAMLGFAKFNEVHQGKAKWAEVGILGIVGAIVLIFARYLLTEAAGVI